MCTFKLTANLSDLFLKSSPFIVRLLLRRRLLCTRSLCESVWTAYGHRSQKTKWDSRAHTRSQSQRRKSYLKLSEKFVKLEMREEEKARASLHSLTFAGSRSTVWLLCWCVSEWVESEIVQSEDAKFRLISRFFSIYFVRQGISAIAVPTSDWANSKRISHSKLRHHKRECHMNE